MGFRTNDLCSFCKGQSESLNHLLFNGHCPYSKQFWNDFETYWCIISSKRTRVSLQNVLVGIITETTDPLHIFLNYFIIIGKLFLWNCRNNQILPNIQGFRAKVVAKYETEKIINKKDFLRKKWRLCLLIFLSSLFLSLCHTQLYVYLFIYLFFIYFYVKYPKYQCTFIASQKEVHQYLQAVEKQRHKHLATKPDKDISNGQRCCVTAIKVHKTWEECFSAFGAAHAPTSNG